MIVNISCTFPPVQLRVSSSLLFDAPRNKLRLWLYPSSKAKIKLFFLNCQTLNYITTIKELNNNVNDLTFFIVKLVLDANINYWWFYIIYRLDHACIDNWHWVKLSDGPLHLPYKYYQKDKLHSAMKYFIHISVI